MSSTVVSPSFRLRRDIKADRVTSNNFDTVNREVQLTFTGPYTETVTAILTSYSGGWTLFVPQFSGTAAGSPVAVMTAILPEGTPLPSTVASQAHPLTNAGAPASGYVSISQVGTVTINTYAGNFSGVCGPLGDFALQYQ